MTTSDNVDRPSNPIYGRHCAGCKYVCLEDWKQCPMCGCITRYGDRFQCLWGAPAETPYDATLEQLRRIDKAARVYAEDRTHGNYSKLCDALYDGRPNAHKANVVVVGPTCGKDTPDGPCRSDIGHDGECDGIPY